MLSMFILGYRCMQEFGELKRRSRGSKSIAKSTFSFLNLKRIYNFESTAKMMKRLFLTRRQRSGENLIVVMTIKTVFVVLTLFFAILWGDKIAAQRSFTVRRVILIYHASC